MARATGDGWCASRLRHGRSAARETVPARTDRTVGAARQSLIAHGNLVAAESCPDGASCLRWTRGISSSPRSCLANATIGKRDICQTQCLPNRRSATSGRPLTQVPKSADTLHPRWRANARPQIFSLAHPPLGQFPGRFSRPPMAGSSSLSIVSSGIFGSIGTGGKNITIERTRTLPGVTHRLFAWYRGTRRPRRRGRMSL